MSYDIKFRKQTIEYYQTGHKYEETCTTFGISSSTLGKWIRLLEETGSLEDAKRKPKTQKIDREKLKEYLEENPDAYQSEIAEHFHCSQPSVCTMLKNCGYTRKKR